jgi:hypothetical protein
MPASHPWLAVRKQQERVGVFWFATVLALTRFVRELLRTNRASATCHAFCSPRGISKSAPSSLLFMKMVLSCFVREVLCNEACQNQEKKRPHHPGSGELEIEESVWGTSPNTHGSRKTPPEGRSAFLSLLHDLRRSAADQFRLAYARPNCVNRQPLGARFCPNLGRRKVARLNAESIG